MRIAIMQPYFFPFIGYFQLINAVDFFILYDDAQYIQRGWVNRNRVLSDGRWTWLTRAVAKASRNLPISERWYLDGPDGPNEVKRKISHLYHKSPHGIKVTPIINSLLDNPERNVAKFNRQHIETLSKYLEISTPFVNSSEILKNSGLHGQSKIIRICKELNATEYINPIGGTRLYDARSFLESGIKLNFIQTKEPLAQVEPEPTFLSIIDCLMSSGIRDSTRKLNNYVIIPA